jgi:hypothetical protein
VIYKVLPVLFGLILAVVSVNATGYEILRHNPFEQPDVTDGYQGGGGNNTTTESMELRGTVIDGQDSLANINGEYVRLNHEVSGYRVIRIESGSVTLGRGGDETVLTLDNEK